MDQVDELLREFWSHPGFFVFEIDERLVPPPLLFIQKAGPFRDVRRRVVLAPQPEVPKLRGDDARSFEFRRFGETKGRFMAPKQLKHFVVEPRLMAKFECRAEVI